ncbi:MAG: hypothetical protein QXM58_02610, partial [Candidatus Micrarchaeaceae archaeon]
ALEYCDVAQWPELAYKFCKFLDEYIQFPEWNIPYLSDIRDDLNNSCEYSSSPHHSPSLDRH